MGLGALEQAVPALGRRVRGPRTSHQAQGSNKASDPVTPHRFLSTVERAIVEVLEETERFGNLLFNREGDAVSGATQVLGICDLSCSRSVGAFPGSHTDGPRRRMVTWAREKFGSSDPELLTALLHGVLHRPEHLQHGLPTGGKFDVDGDRAPAGSLGRLIAAHANQVEARELVHQSQESLRMESQDLPDLLRAVHLRASEERKEAPGLGVSEEVGEGLRRSYQHAG